MASGWYSQIEGDITVTAQMRIYVNGAEWLPPNDWILHLATEGNRIRVTVERDGSFIPLSEAVVLKGMLTTSSKPHLRAPQKPSALPGAES